MFRFDTQFRWLANYSRYEGDLALSMITFDKVFSILWAVACRLVVSLSVEVLTTHSMSRKTVFIYGPGVGLYNFMCIY